MRSAQPGSSTARAGERVVVEYRTATSGWASASAQPSSRGAAICSSVPSTCTSPPRTGIQRARAAAACSRPVTCSHASPCRAPSGWSCGQVTGTSRGAVVHEVASGAAGAAPPTSATRAAPRSSTSAGRTTSPRARATTSSRAPSPSTAARSRASSSAPRRSTRAATTYRSRGHRRCRATIVLATVVPVLSSSSTSTRGRDGSSVSRPGSAGSSRWLVACECSSSKPPAAS